ncbi:MAG: hypothetical protein JW765_05370 [Deltaproteobacteria bacterium]|nr:hypothetical protein [Candidatus Zymogenaceae bacterium]
MSSNNDNSLDVKTFILAYLQQTGLVDKDVDIREEGDFIHYGGKLIPIGGILEQIQIDANKILSKKGSVGVVGWCGHSIGSRSDVGGFCMVCGGIFCAREGCLAICEETGMSVCRLDRIVTSDGRIVAREEARKLSFKIKSLIKPKRKELPDVQGRGGKPHK